jgi:hypothetical protein
MKRLSLLLVLFCSTIVVPAQTAPLTQAEYVKMLYALQKNPSGKTDIAEILRSRGISFVVTEGIRGLTRSKTGNDEEVRRALDEADRRRQNPESTKLPSAKEAAEVIERSRKATLEALDQMPDFVVKQVISRSEAYAGTGNWKPIDTVIIAVSYSTEKGEQYRVLSQNGAPVEATTGSDYSNFNGSTTSGEFVEDLAKLYKPESKTDFKVFSTDVVRGRPALVYDFEIAIENNRNGGVGFKTQSGTKGFSFTSVPAGEKGKVWIDRETGRVLRIEYTATNIPHDFRVKAYDSSINYDWVEIAGEKYLLPVLSDNRFTSAESGQLFQSRNLIRFKNYQRYGTDVKILDDDLAPEKEEKK